MNLHEFFIAHPKVALGFSGGTDSSFLLWAGLQDGAEVTPYFVKSQFQPAFELEDAKRLCDELQVELKILPLDVLKNPCVLSNPADRCYHCKQAVFGTILEAARKDGHTVLIDGTNASDDAGDRPGMRSLQELGVYSPLRDCGITKEEVRRRSKEAGLFTWDKPSYACLATRIPAGTPIDAETLRNIEQTEGLLMDLGFLDFRVRTLGTTAKLQIKPEQLGKVLEKREQILKGFEGLFADVVLDLKTR